MPFLEDQLRHAINETVESGLEWCVALESKSDSNIWVQLTAEHINICYPFADDPASQLALIGWPLPSLDLASWETGSFATFHHGADETVGDACEFVRKYIETLLEHSVVLPDWNQTEHDI